MGLFDKATGSLVKTLLSGHRHARAGPLELPGGGLVWDGSSDQHSSAMGHAVRLTGLEVRVQHSNVSYTWEGVIGNTGPATGPNTLVSGGEGPVSLAINGNVGFVAVGYNEVMTHFWVACPPFLSSRIPELTEESLTFPRPPNPTTRHTHHPRPHFCLRCC